MKKCKKCGGVLIFDPNTCGLMCNKCSEHQDFERTNDYNKHSFLMTDHTDEGIDMSQVKFHCPSCGASFEGKTYSLSDICSYCGGHLVANLNENGLPDAIIPFAFDKQTAKKIFKTGMGKKWFLPNKFKKEPPMDLIESICIPAYLCEIETDSSYKGRIYENKTDNDGNSSRYYKMISGTELVATKDIMIECSSYLSQTTLNQIKPYYFTKLYKFRPEFLYGYSVEYYDKNLDKCKGIIEEIVKSNIRMQILRHYRYDGVDYLNINTVYDECKYSKIVLPSYRVKYTYKQKEYSTFLNGQTGKIGGNIPRSKLKIGFFVGGIVAAICALSAVIVAVVGGL